MDKEEILEILNDDLLNKLNTITVGSYLKDQNLNYLNEYTSVTLLDFLAYSKIDMLELNGIITPEVAYSLKEMLNEYLEIKNLLNSEDVTNEEKEELVSEYIYLGNELNKYNILIDLEDNIIEKLISIDIKEDTKKLSLNSRKN